MDKIRYTAASGKPHKCNPVHYNGNSKKSQWLPPVPLREFRLFELADEREWTENESDYWSLETDGKNPQVLGKHPNGLLCRLARYRRDVNTAPWHGYPITLKRKGEEVPPTAVLRKWVERDKVLQRAWRRKIVERHI